MKDLDMQDKGKALLFYIERVPAEIIPVTAEIDSKNDETGFSFIVEKVFHCSSTCQRIVSPIFVNRYEALGFIVYTGSILKTNILVPKIIIDYLSKLEDRETIDFFMKKKVLSPFFGIDRLHEGSGSDRNNGYMSACCNGNSIQEGILVLEILSLESKIFEFLQRFEAMVDKFDLGGMTFPRYDRVLTIYENHFNELKKLVQKTENK